ncbi:MAG: PEP-CTERM sorting domain-containing protein [Verrucomicrobiota bacterium]
MKNEFMKNESQSNLIQSTGITAAGRILLGLMLVAGTAASVQAQGQIASGTISGSGSGPYTYSLSFSDAAGATSPVGSVWYAWTPGNFYLPGVPTSASAPAGWTATVSSDSVQFVANAPADYITAGSSLSGFGYQAAFSPAQLAAAANSGRSDAYSGGLFSDAGDIFTVQTVTVPEPSSLMLLICGATGLCLIGRRRLRAA